MLFIENETTELKEIAVDDLKKEVIAFANCNGGKIYIGVADDGTIVGVEKPDEELLRITNMMRDAIKPDITMFLLYELLYIDEKAVILIEIQRGMNRPYYLAAKGLRPEGVYVRQGTSCVSASNDAIRQMIRETDGDIFEEMRSLQQELTFDIAAKTFSERNLDFTAVQMQTLGILNNDHIYTNLGLLLSDQCPHTIKAATFAGINQNMFQDRREFSGSLLQQLNDAYNYIDFRNQTQATFDKLYRIDTRDYPEVALREALLNALVHRDYSYSASIIIGVYDDRMEFTSIGGLMPGVTLNDVLLGLSVCRNAKLANIFYRLELIEAYGTGLSKIINAYADSEDKPQIIVSDNAFKIILPNRNYRTPESAKQMQVHESPYRYQTNKQNDNAAAAYITDSATKSVLALASEQSLISRKEVQEELQISQATAGRLLKQMVDAGLLLQHGNGRSVRYYLPK